MKDKSIVRMDFPSNSHKQKTTEKEEPTKKIEKVISGSVKTRKKGLLSRFTETFFGDDVESVTSYIIHDVLVPAAKSTFSDMVSGGVEMLLFGEKRGSRTSRDRGRSYVSYNNYHGRSDERRREERHTSKNRSRHNFDDIVFEIRGEAEEVLSHLVDLIEEYGMASVSDLYELVGVPTNFTDNKFGWTNLARASVSRVREGYVINLPKPTTID